MISAVYDTNILLSGFLFGGKSREVLSLAVKGEVLILISHQLLEEVMEVNSRPRFSLPPTVIQDFAVELLNISRLVTTRSHFHTITRDQDDNRVLECAVDGRAEFIVSGDADLLDLGVFRSIKIVNAAEFLIQFRNRDIP